MDSHDKHILFFTSLSFSTYVQYCNQIQAYFFMSTLVFSLWFTKRDRWCDGAIVFVKDRKSTKSRKSTVLLKVP